jgi:membrane associated rhomboid family serine protease
LFFPIRDNIPSRTTPYVNWIIIAANILVFIYQSGLGYSHDWFIFQYGLVPRRAIHFSSLVPDTVIPFFTHMFMHGGFFHLFSNMYILYIFGDNVEDRLGHGRYLVMYLLFGLFAGFAQLVINSNSLIPMVGASGAIAGVMGAYLVFYPHAKVRSLVIIIIFITFIDIPAVFYLLFWFFIQFLNGAASLGYDGAGVAWWAHIGGFLFGLLAAYRIKNTRVQEYYRY